MVHFNTIQNKNKSYMHAVHSMYDVLHLQAWTPCTVGRQVNTLICIYLCFADSVRYNAQTYRSTVMFNLLSLSSLHLACQNFNATRYKKLLTSLTHQIHTTTHTERTPYLTKAICPVNLMMHDAQDPSAQCPLSFRQQLTTCVYLNNI